MLLKAFKRTYLFSVPSTTVSFLFKANQTTSLQYLGSFKRSAFHTGKVHFGTAVRCLLLSVIICHFVLSFGCQQSQPVHHFPLISYHFMLPFPYSLGPLLSSFPCPSGKCPVSITNLLEHHFPIMLQTRCFVIF